MYVYDAPAGAKRTLARNVTVWPTSTVVGEALARIDSSEPPSTVISSGVPGTLATLCPPAFAKRVVAPSSLTIGPGLVEPLISGAETVMTLPSPPTTWTNRTAPGL